MSEQLADNYYRNFLYYYIDTDLDINTRNSNYQNGLNYFLNEEKQCDDDCKYLVKCYIGVFYYLLDNDKKAIRYINDSIKLNDKYVFSLYYRGRILLYKNKVKQPLKDLERAISLHNNLGRNIITKGSLYNYIGFLYYRKKLYNKSIDYYNKSIEDGNHISYYNRSISCFELGKYDEALNDIIRFMNFMESYYDLESVHYNNRALFEGFVDHLELAHKYFNKSINCDNNRTLETFYFSYLILSKNINMKRYFYKILQTIIKKDFNIKSDILENNIFYKYRCINISTLKLISNNNDKVKNLRLSNYNYFNDPIDPPIKLNIYNFKNIKNIDRIKICSLAVEYDNFLMWSHYADEHKGICIEYDISYLKKLNSKINKLILKKVIYTNKIITNKVYPYILKNKDIEYENKFISLFYIKHKNWQYENEYRIIADTKEEYIYLPIKAIYFGMNASDDDIKLIKSLVKDDTVKFYKMKSDKDNLFNLIREEI
ncbi:DUF2971 domain-containing protein [uncultured Brachyspira sp.]|uniref:DUF2971 domain-containing protein n=1 Tax=uncultured Brachyspira sp. TaxID=221953 RepID=UPI0026384185|nr:DUF2971 domain-containing protein [uncultured Brachyspira sp.]